ncbi:MAG: radical SAM protein [candidate division Zixibacteria bacterium]|nr:radical SAM protein [candidate division Zixibacteria bacterium]
MLKGYVDEVFVSVQGEGPLVGTPMLFVRFGGCVAACEHCDTPRARTRASQFVIRGPKAEVVPNPVKVADLTARVEPLLRNLPYFAVTGGEPLEQPGFLSLLLTRLSETGKRVLLETRGQHYRELAEVLPRVDVIAVDVKLPSFSGKPLPREETKNFLEIAKQRTCYVKVVVGPDTEEAEVLEAARLVADVRGRIPFVVQPRRDESTPPPGESERLLALAVRLTDTLDDVRLIPQVHRALGLR